MRRRMEGNRLTIRNTTNVFFTFQIVSNPLFGYLAIKCLLLLGCSEKERADEGEDKFKLDDRKGEERSRQQRVQKKSKL